MCNNEIMGITITWISFEKLIFQPSYAFYISSVALMVILEKVVICHFWIRTEYLGQVQVSSFSRGSENLTAEPHLAISGAHGFHRL